MNRLVLFFMSEKLWILWWRIERSESISVAVVDSVEMDNDEEDAMLEAIQIAAYEENVEAATSD